MIAVLLSPIVLGGAAAAADPDVPPPFGIWTGSSSGSNGNTTGSAGQENSLGLGPAVSSQRWGRDTLRVETPVPAPDAAIARAPARSTAAPDGAGSAIASSDTSLAQMLGLDSGSVQTACAGSAVVGGSGILAGVLTGSGLLGPGSDAVGSSGSALEGGGSALGSAAVGSAAAGSAILTCLLLLPALSPQPELPLRIPSAPGLPVVPVRAPTPPPVRPPVPEIRPAPSTIAESVPPKPLTAPAPPAPVPWNTLELITVLVVSVIGTVRIGTAGSSARNRS